MIKNLESQAMYKILKAANEIEAIIEQRTIHLASIPSSPLLDEYVNITSVRIEQQQQQQQPDAPDEQIFKYR